MDGTHWPFWGVPGDGVRLLAVSPLDHLNPFHDDKQPQHHRWLFARQVVKEIDKTTSLTLVPLPGAGFIGGFTGPQPALE